MRRPDFRLRTPNPNPQYITDAEWWFWEQLHELEPDSELGGIYADKSGYHTTGEANERKWPGNYSIRDAADRRGPWWRTKASALDWTFPDAQRGRYTRIGRYTSRLMASAKDPNDPRLDMVLREFYGQDDNDRIVEGYDERHEELVSSDPSHLWHIHFSFIRSKCGDFWAMWALLTVLMGWTVAQWRDSLEDDMQQTEKLAYKTSYPHRTVGHVLADLSNFRDWLYDAEGGASPENSPPAGSRAAQLLTGVMSAKADIAAVKADVAAVKTTLAQLATTPPGSVLISDEQLERVLRRVLGSVDGASPPAS